MLKVTDDGVNIQLQPSPTATTLLKQILVFAVVVSFIGLLKWLNVISPIVMGLLVFIALIGMGIWAFWQNKTQVKTLHSGQLLLTPHRFIHQNDNQTTQYQLTAQDTIERSDNGLKICNQQGKILYQINGFSEPKHLEVAQAVLNGKTIKTQGKAIKMQSS